MQAEKDVRSDAALLEAEIRQQEHLAFDLHDSAGQRLTGISLLLAALNKAAGRVAACVERRF